MIVRKTNPPASSKPTVTIGAILPLSGELSHVGRDVKKAITFAVNKFNENPENVLNYKLAIEDDQAKPTKTVIALQKLLCAYDLSAVLSVFSRPGRVLQPLVIREKLIHFATMCSHVSDGEYTFNNFETTEEFVPATYEFIESRGFDNIAIMFHDNESGQELLDAFRLGFKEKRIPFGEYNFKIGDKDFSQTVAKLKTGKHDLILLYGLMPELGLINKELVRQKVKVPVLGYDIFEVGGFDSSLFDGYFEVGVHENQAWMKEIGLGSSYRADYVYDSINIIMQTYERAGKGLGRVPMADEFRDALYEVRVFEGITGKSILKRSGKFVSKTYLKQVVNGKIVMLDE